jgi:hypothetical protein
MHVCAGDWEDLEASEMHPNLDELLDLRDGDGAAEVARHVQFCGQCAHQLAELRATAAELRALPAMEAADDQWPRIVDRAVRRRRRLSMISRAAAAAGLVAALAAVMVTRYMPTDEAVPSPPETDAQLAVEQLTSASRELELVLKSPSLRFQVMSPRRAAIIVDIEDRIALVDLALAEGVADPPDELAVALWSDRVELLDALVTARTAAPGGEPVVFADISFEGSK